MVVQSILKNCFLFKGLPEEYITELQAIGSTKSFSKKENIFFEGDPAKGFYIVMSGRVKIYKMSAEGREQILHVFGPGEPFGEAAVFANISFPANASAIEPTETFFIPRSKFVWLLENNPSLSMNLLAILSRRLMIFARMIGELSLKEVPGRLATYLLILSSRHGGTSSLKLDLTKSQLASLLGTIPETLSRILSRMQRQGLIKVNGANIEILDRDKLEDISGLMEDIPEIDFNHD